MSSGAPRMTIETNEEASRNLGKVSTLCVGYGIHQAWVYAAMFGTASVFGLPYLEDGSALTPVFTYSVIVYAICLLLFGVFDQKVLPFLVRRRNACIAAIAIAAGTLLILPSGMDGAAGTAICIASGVLTGFGSATLIEFWGTAYSRHSSGSILTNTALAIVISVAIYVVLLHVVPAPYSGIIAACLPLAELAFLWNHTPIPYMERHEVPIFSPLPINRLRLLALLGLPMLLFGFALGFMRLETVVYMVSRIDIGSQLPLLFSAGCAAVIIVLAGFIFINDERPNVLLRPILPIVALSMLFIPLSQSSNNITYAVIVMAGYMCLEGLVWILLGSMAQRFRISPVRLFGIGRGNVAVGMLLAFAFEPGIHALFPVENSEAIANVVTMLVALVAAFAFMPHISDIRRAISREQDFDQAIIDALNGSEGIVPREDANTATEQEQAEETPAQEAPHADGNGQPRRHAGSEQGDPQPDAEQRGGLFRKKCERIADRYLLSAREAEVLFFLAKGHNAAAIMEKLYISEGTAKTHIRHIYSKTDVHNQQELMKMVSEEWID